MREFAGTLLILLLFTFERQAEAMAFLNKQGCAVTFESTTESKWISDNTDQLARLIKHALESKILDPHRLGRIYLGGVRGSTRKSFVDYFSVTLKIASYMHKEPQERPYTLNEYGHQQNLESLKNQAGYFAELHPEWRSVLNDQWRFTVRKLSFEAVGLDPKEKDAKLASLVNEAEPEE